MGVYINPPKPWPEVSSSGYVDQAGEWLRAHCVTLHPPMVTPPWPAPDDAYYVCLVFNPQWTAAAVAYSLAEYGEFVREDDRMKAWHTVPKDKVHGVIIETEEDIARLIKEDEGKLNRHG